MMEVLTLLLGVLVVLAITVVTGYFVAQEFAYMAVDRSALTARAAAGDAAADRALTVTRRTSFMLSGAQLGITVTGLPVGYVAEPLIGESLGVERLVPSRVRLELPDAAPAPPRPTCSAGCSRSRGRPRRDARGRPVHPADGLARRPEG